MTQIYDLQQRAEVLRKKTATDSISPEDVGGLQADTLAYIANMERYASSLGIKKVYTSVSEMNGDESPVSSTGMPLKAGQLVTIFNAETPDAENSGEIYAFQNPGWVLVGRLDASNMECLKKINSLPTTLSFLQYDEFVNGEGIYFTNATYLYNKETGVYEFKKGSDETKPLIPMAGHNVAGIMSIDDKKKLDSIKQMSYIDHGTSDTSAEIGAFEYHKWGEVPQIFVNVPNKPTTDEGVVNVYMLEFKSGSTPAKIVWPLHIKTRPNTIEANKTYQITIINNLASVKSFT